MWHFQLHCHVQPQTVLELTRTLWDPIYYVATKLISVKDMTARLYSKECAIMTEFNFRFQLHTCQPSGTFICVTMQKFSKIGLLAAASRAIVS